jgi:hypothetical protein
MKKTIRKKKIVKRRDIKKRVTRKKYYKNNLGGKGALLSLFTKKKSSSVDLLKEEFANVWKNRECSAKLYDSINEYLRLCIWVMKNDSEITDEVNMFEYNLNEIAFSISIMSFEFYTNKQYNKCEIVENTKETMRELVDVIKARGRSIPWRYNEEDGWNIKQNIVKL